MLRLLLLATTAASPALAQHSGLDASELRLERPKDPALGDLAFPCFAVAKARKSPPASVASAR